MAKQSFQVTVEFLANTSNLQDKIKTLGEQISKIGTTSGGAQVQKQFDQLAQAIQNLQTKAKQPITSQSEFNKLINELSKTESSYNSLIGTLDRLYNLSDNKKLELIPKSEQARIKNAEEAIEKYETAISNSSKKVKEFRELQANLAKQTGIKATAAAEIKKYTAALSEAQKQAEELSNKQNELNQKIAQAESERRSAQGSLNAAKKVDNEEDIKKYALQVDQAKAKITSLKSELAGLEGQLSKTNAKANEFENLLKQSTTESNTAKATIKQLKQDLSSLDNNNIQILQNAFEQLKTKARELGVNLQGISDISNVDTLIQRMQKLKGEGLEQANAAIEKMANSANSLLNPALQRLRESAYDNTNAFEAFNRAQGDLESLKSRVGYFFSMTNSLMLLRRALTSALNTVKELDAVMTETAVVTDFTVGDMWEKLPEYSKQASALGASIKDLYSATTLYYQQGLNTEAAMGVGIETMKMARIAGMEAADATEAMTAALRGFNMEVNETNAVRVNDVYSELAAITAADTEQIATAMSKTASIAASANMEFETTAALLAQIIETTQEAPETAGTALKTIIARFAEVKKLRSEGTNTGEDEEGEIIDVNKIQGALRTVGISMDEFFAGTKGLDSILLELAEKWNTLDFETQRYIATTAAGSRQQSRFIAMMSDYERTMELATAANNSAGASQQQFNKTLESMEAKLQKMHNAWNQFTMGLANNQILKGGVDLLTGLLKAINGLTEAVSGGNGAVKSVLNLGVALMGLKAGGAVLSGVLASISMAQADKGFNLGKNVKTGFANAFSGLKNIKPNIPKIDFDTAGLKAYQASLAGYQASLKQVTIAQKEYQVAVWQSNMENASDVAVQNAKIVVNQAEVASKQQLTVAAEQLAAATGLENQQAQQAILLNSQGLSLEWAVAAAKAGVTAEGLKEAAVQEIENAAGKKGIVISQAELIAKQKEILARKGVFVAINTGILGRIEEIAMTKLGTASVIAKTWADKLETKGLQSKTAAMIASLGIIGLIIAAVALLTAGIIALYKHVQSNSLEGRLKAAEEATNRAAEAANQAADAYENLKSSLESLEEKENILEELTTGTREWKETVADLNSQILDLITKYPELAKIVSSSSGILTISDEGKEEVLQKRYEQKNATIAAKAGAQLQEEILQRQLNYNQLDTKLGEYRVNVEGYENGLSYDDYIKAEINAGTSEEAAIAKAENSQMLWYDDREKTEELARAIASGDWEGKGKEIKEIGGINSESFNDLKAYGENLLASDAAIKVFTDSLMNAAIVNADVSEEYKDSLGGLYDAELINKMIETAKDEIDLTDEEKREEYEKEYAKVMGYQYEDGKFYSGEGENKKEVVVLDQDIKSQLAAINVQKAMTDNLSKVSNELENLHNSGIKLGQSFINMASKADGAGLTLADLDNLEGVLNEDLIKRDENGKITQWSQELADLYAEVGYLYSSPEEFYRIFSDAYSQASERASQAQYKLSSMGLKGQFDSAKIDTGALFEISNSLYDVFLRSGSEATQQLGQKLSEITSSLSPENAQIFANALNSLDWNNIDSIKELDTILSGMGFTGQIKDIEALEWQIMSAAKAGRDFSLEKVKEELKSLANLKTDLKERIEDENYTFTEEEKDEYLKEMPELKEQFVQTDADEWVYIGGHLEDLQGALNENTKAVLAKTEEDAKGKAQESQKWIDLMDSTKQYEYTSKRFNDTGTAEYTVSESGTFSEVVSGILDGTILDTEVMVSVLESLNADTSGNITDLVNRIEMLFTENYGANGAVAASNISNYEDAQKATSSVALSYKNPYELADMVQNTTTRYNGSVLETQAVDNSAYLDALNAQAKQAGVTTTEIERLTKAQEEQGKSGDEAKAAALAQAISMKKQQAAINEASEAIGEYLETMDDAEKDSITYNEALSKIPKQIEKAFGFEPSTEWVQDNLDLIKDWAAGSEEAGAQIWENLTNGFSSAMAACEANVGQSVTNMVDWLNWFSGTNVWANAYLDNSGFMNAIATSETEAKEFADWLETQGYETELIFTGTKPVTYKGMIYDGSMMREHVYTVNQPQYQIKWKNTGNPWTGGGGGGYNAPSSYTPKSSGGGGGGGGSKTKWENPYDEFYNVVEDINEELRTREKLERRYQALLDKTGTKASDLVKNARDQINSLEKQKKLREGLLEGRTRQMSDIESEYSDLSKYAWYNEQDGTIEIDWEKINALDGSTNEKLTSRIEEYIKKLEEQQDLIEQEEDELEAIEETLREIRDQGKDEYFDFEEQIKDALIDQRQKEIDKLSAINDSINDTNSRLIDAMQSSIDKYRQDRENERTEEELSDKQRRLAYLQQDTSGANALEIMQLQEEIDQGMEDYTDQLIDQKINELQEQNDEAAEQREKQIAIAEAQLKKWEESGEIWNNVYELISSGIDEDGIVPGSELQNLLKEAANFEGMSKLQKMDWLEELENNVGMAIQWLMVGNSTEALISKGELSKGQQITFTTSDGDEVTGILQDNGDVIDSQGNVYTDVYRDQEGNWVTEEETKKAENGGGTSTGGTGDEEDTSNQQQTNYPYGKASEVSGEVKYGDRGKKVKAVQWALKKLGYSIGSSGVDGIFGNDTLKAVKKFQRKSKISADGVVGKNTKKAFKLKQYASGGLADFTGPAWLDGTKSKPEYILNAEQTKSFFKLVDILSDLKSGTNQSSQITGDSIYDVDINVESIGSDYDVEKLATTIKRMINDEARYRNNNAINLQR